MEKVEVNIGGWIQGGISLYKENLPVLVLASLVAVGLSVVTGAILAGPMMAGLVYIALALYDQQTPKPQVGDVFKGFRYFLNSFLFVLVWGLGTTVASAILHVIPIIGQLAGMILSLLVPAVLMFSLFLIVERDTPFWPASMESIAVVRTNFWPFVGFGVLLTIISSIGALAFGVGIIFTLPLALCINVVAYREVFGR
ncbi:MAG: hypothetical protein HQK55_02720 [Deltaproteobacteria bacterium]|nr:hypothetical protein [Deltaproteobacteria bacterium]